jgi:hypothetical protein
MILPLSLGSAFSTPQWSRQNVRGVFVIVPRGVPRADHDVDLVLRRGVVEPKIQPRAQSLTQGLMGHLPKIIESQDHGKPK